MNANEAIEAAAKKQFILHTKSGTVYKIIRLSKHKGTDDKWIETISYENKEGNLFSRTSDMFKGFTASSKSIIKDKNFDEAVKTLKLIRKVQEEKNVIITYGVDLTNYESGLENRLIEMCAHLLGCDLDSINWWVYDSPKGNRKYYFDSIEIEIDLEEAEAFAAYHYKKSGQ